jgi:glycosyltransferase involved in cell wall biosynthesis
MKVIIASTTVPWIRGGGTFIVDWLEMELLRRGHDVDTYRIPFTRLWHEIPEQTAALRLWRFADPGDRLIAIRTPSYAIKHHAKNVWFIHHFREAYDLWGSSIGGLPDTPQGRAVRDSIRYSDNVALSEARNIFTNSRIVGDRLRNFNGIESTPVYPPLMHPERYHDAGFGDYVVYVSRMNVHKRQMLALEAMAHTKSMVRLVLAGAIEVPQLRAQMQAFVERNGLAGRVHILDRFISEEEKIDLIAHSAAVVYVPIDEDSYGYPSLEAAAAGKPVISTVDGGGTRELIVDGKNGWLVEPTPDSLARAYDEAYRDRAFARQMGMAMAQRVTELGCDWDTTVERLLA